MKIESSIINSQLIIKGIGSLKKDTEKDDVLKEKKGAWEAGTTNNDLCSTL